MSIKPTLLNWSFIEELAARMTKGAESHQDKPGRPFYLDLPEKDLEDKLSRHMIAYLSGEKIDPGTNQSHLVAIGANAMMTWARQADGAQPKPCDHGGGEWICRNCPDGAHCSVCESRNV